MIVVPKYEIDIEQPQPPLNVSEPAPKLPEKPKMEKISLWELKSAHNLKIKILYAININAGHMWVCIMITFLVNFHFSNVVSSW